jgi:hypothetical protein
MVLRAGFDVPREPLGYTMHTLNIKPPHQSEASGLCAESAVLATNPSNEMILVRPEVNLSVEAWLGCSKGWMD